MTEQQQPSFIKRLSWNAYLALQMRGQARIPFRAWHDLERIQSRRVRAMVSHAYASVPYYRRTMDAEGLRPEDIRCLTDLDQLPIIEKEQLLHEPEQFRSSARSVSDGLSIRTGGSTGIACEVRIDTATLFQNAAHGERERAILTEVMGSAYGNRETIIGSPTTTDQVVQHFTQSRGYFPERLRMKRQYLSLLDPPEVNLAKINSFKPLLLRSYGSYLEELFSYLKRSGAQLVSPRLITYSSDALSPAMRTVISEEYGIPVFSFYESVEAFKIGFECGHADAVHQNADLYPVKIVDDNDVPVSSGEVGQVILSNLVNRATVLLNYRLGDLATLLPEPCSCGRSLPLLSLPQGRNDEFLILEGGKRVHPQSVRTVVLEEDGVWQFQAVQESKTRLQLTVIPNPNADLPVLEKQLRTGLQQVLGQNIEVDVVFAEHIPRRENASKFRVVLSKVNQPAQERERKA